MVRLELLPLLSRRVVIDRVAVNGPVLTLPPAETRSPDPAAGPAPTAANWCGHIAVTATSAFR